MKHFASIAAAALGIALVPAAAHAQTAPAQKVPAPTAGATVYGPKGEEVGKIESITNGVAVVSTGTQKAGIPLANFGTSPKGPTLGWTRDQLNEVAAKAAADAAAKLRAQIVPGAQVHGTGGAILGTVKEVKGDQVVLDTGTRDAQLAMNTIGANAQGLFIGMTKEQFDAALGPVAPAAPATPAAQ